MENIEQKTREFIATFVETFVPNYTLRYILWMCKLKIEAKHEIERRFGLISRRGVHWTYIYDNGIRVCVRRKKTVHELKNMRK